MKSLYILTTIIIILLCNPSLADDNEKNKLAIEYMRLVKHNVSEMRSMAIQGRYAYVDRLKANNPYINERQVKIMKEEYRKVIDEELTDENLLNGGAGIYASTYTVEELKKLVELAKNPSLAPILFELTTKGRFVRQSYYYNSVVGIKLYPMIKKRAMDRFSKEMMLENKYNK